MRAGRWLVASIAVASLLVVPAAQAKGTATVYMGPPNPKLLPKMTDLNAFYPGTVTINRGQSVSFNLRGFHTASFMSGQAPPPLIVPDLTKPYPAQNDAAGNPFWWSSTPVPSVVFNSAVRKATKASYAGKGFRNSGLDRVLARRPKPFRLKFTKTGTFSYRCLVHPGMKGKVKVVAPGRPTRSRRGDQAAALAQAGAATKVIKQRLKYKGPSGNRVLAGYDKGAATLFKMFPAKRTVPVGTAVTFLMSAPNEVHTFTFGPTAYRKQVSDEFFSPRGYPTLGARGTLPSDPPPLLPPYDGANHGNGFLSGGLLDEDPASPLPAGQTVTFTKAGTFEYECIVHLGMKGTIVVQ